MASGIDLRVNDPLRVELLRLGLLRAEPRGEAVFLTPEGLRVLELARSA